MRLILAALVAAIFQPSFIQTAPTAGNIKADIAKRPALQPQVIRFKIPSTMMNNFVPTESGLEQPDDNGNEEMDYTGENNIPVYNTPQQYLLNPDYIPADARLATTEEIHRPYDGLRQRYSNYVVGGFVFSNLFHAHQYVAAVKKQLYLQAIGWRRDRNDLSINPRQIDVPFLESFLPDGRLELTTVYPTVQFDSHRLRWCTFTRLPMFGKNPVRIGCFEDPADAAYAHYLVQILKQRSRQSLSSMPTTTTSSSSSSSKKPPVSKNLLFDQRAINQAVENFGRFI